MSSHKSTRKKINRYEVLGETVNEQKNTTIVEPSSIVTEQFPKPLDMDTYLKESFHKFQNKSATQFL